MFVKVQKKVHGICGGSPAPVGFRESLCDRERDRAKPQHGHTATLLTLQEPESVTSRWQSDWNVGLTGLEAALGLLLCKAGFGRANLVKGCSGCYVVFLFFSFL